MLFGNRSPHVRGFLERLSRAGLCWREHAIFLACRAGRYSSQLRFQPGAVIDGSSDGSVNTS